MLSEEMIKKANNYVSLVIKKETNIGWSIFFFYLSISAFLCPFFYLHIAISEFGKYGLKSDVLMTYIVTAIIIYFFGLIALLISDRYDRVVKRTPCLSKISVPGWSDKSERAKFLIFTFFKYKKSSINPHKKEIDENVPPRGGLAVLEDEFEKVSKKRFSLTRRPVTVHSVIKNLKFMKDDATVYDTPVKIQMHYDIEIRFVGDILPLSFYCNYGYCNEALFLFKEMVYKNVNQNIVLPRFDILFNKCRDELVKIKKDTPRDELVRNITETTLIKMEDECRDKEFSISCLNGNEETKINIKLKNIRPHIDSIVKAPAL